MTALAATITGMTNVTNSAQPRRGAMVQTTNTTETTARAPTTPRRIVSRADDSGSPVISPSGSKREKEDYADDEVDANDLDDDRESTQRIRR